MPSDLLTLRDIKARLNAGSLVLNEETVGQGCFSTLTGSFQQKTKEFALVDCKIVEDGGDAFVTFDGTFSRLNPRDNVAVKFTLFDHLAKAGTTERHSVFAIAVPRSCGAYHYLNQYTLDGADPAHKSLIPFNPDLADLLSSIEFSGAADQPAELIFSSVDYSTPAHGAIYYPKRLEGLLPAREVGKGINFRAAVTLDENLTQLLSEVFASGPGKGGTDLGLIHPGADGPFLRFRKSLKATQTVGSVSLELEGIAFVLPLSGRAESGIQVLLDGAVKLGDRSFRISADFDPYDQQVALSIRDFPSLSELMKLAGFDSLNDFFPEPLSSLLDVQLSHLGIVLSLADGGSISEVSAALTTKKELELIPKVVSIQPSLAVRVHAPLDEESREIEGELKGDWQLGGTRFETALLYPSYAFHAGMVAGQTLDAKALLAKMLPGIPLPELQLKKMEVDGNFLSQSFSAEIEVDGKSAWTFSLAGKKFGVESIKVGMSYEDGTLAGCSMDGRLSLAGVDVFISAQYEEHWTLLGGTAVGACINLKTGLTELLQNLSLPADLPDLKLTDIVFFASPDTAEYSIRGQTAGDWKLTDKLSFRVEQFSASCKDSDLTGVLIVVLTIDQIILRLSARKAAASQGGGWQFDGSTGAGQEIKIGAMIDWVATQFGAVSLPDSIKNCTIKKLDLGFNTESQNFTFTCEAVVRLPETKGEINGTVVIAIERQADGSYKKTLGGTLVIRLQEIQTLNFNVLFATESKVQAFLATYHGQQKVSIDDLLKQVFSEPITTGVELTLKDALFAYYGDVAGAKYLFGLNIGINIGLAKLPLVGPALPREMQIGIDDLRIVAATRAFRVLEVDHLNKLIPEKVAKLPGEKADGGDAALRKGLNVSAKLNLAGADKLLTLPAAETGAATESTTPPPPVQPITPEVVAKAAPSAGISKWFDIQKSVGPLRLQRLGVQYKDQRLGFLFDAGMDLLGVRLDLLGLSVSLPLKTPLGDPKFGLEGLELAIRQKPLEIAGALLKVSPTGEGISFQYDGRVLVRAEVFSLAALGSYAEVHGKPSLFIFAVLHKELGGPAFFFVTGLAFGFGVNRQLRLPAISDVHNFPLIKGATDPEYFGSNATPRTALQKLQEYIPPSVGDYWLAAGVKFNSFGMIDSFAVLTVSFGTQFQIAILGLSRITVPRQLPGAPKIDPVACAELAIKVSFTLASGLLAAEARLTENSFVFSKDCKLTGGFALYCWFGPENAGDFVVTLGGYHPRFLKPSHYPEVPRLGMNWSVSDNLAIAGELYFALTPSCLMAGGKLSATYQAGNLRAWFYAFADFLIGWKPFFYDIEMGIRVGVSYRLSALGITRTLTFELGAWVKMWGPPFSGTARITFYILSFDIAFGAAQQPELKKVEWEEFEQSFLPQAEKTDADPLVGAIRITSGLIKEQEISRNGNKRTLRVVNAHELSFTTESVLPATSVLFNNQPIGVAAERLGIRPMDIKAVTSVHAVTLEPKGPRQKDWASHVTSTLVTKSVPDALWSSQGLTRLEQPAAKMIKDVPNGVRVGLQSRAPSHGLAPMELAKFKFSPIPMEIGWEDRHPPSMIIAQPGATLANTIWGNEKVDKTRKGILAALGKEKTAVELKRLAENSTELFQSPPDVAQLGEPFKKF